MVKQVRTYSGTQFCNGIGGLAEICKRTVMRLEYYIKVYSKFCRNSLLVKKIHYILDK